MNHHLKLELPRLAALVGLLLCSWLWPAGSAAAVLDPRAIQSETLHNGLRLVVSSDPESRVAAVEVIVRMGAADEQPGQRGFAHLLEHVLWSGPSSGEGDPRSRVESVGGVMNAGTLRDYTRFYATVPSNRLRLALDALAETVLRSDFEERIIARERQVIGEEAAARSDDPSALLSDLAFAELYGPGHPYSNPLQGRPGDLEAASPSQLALFHSTWYLPNNMAVIVCGDVTFEAVREVVVELFGALRPAPVPPRERPVPPRPSAGGVRTVELPIDRAYVMAAFIGPEVAEHSAVCASDLLATLLVHGATGRLDEELKEKQNLVLEVGVDFLTQRDRALFGVWAVCDPTRVESVRAGIRQVLGRLAREPAPTAELSSARRLLAAGYAFANETPSDRAGTLGFYEAIDSYRTACSYVSWMLHTRAENVTDAAGWYAGEPLWIILLPEKTP